MLPVVPWRLGSLIQYVQYFDLVLDISFVFCGNLNLCMKLDFDFYICFSIHTFGRDNICPGTYLHLFGMSSTNEYGRSRIREETKIYMNIMHFNIFLFRFGYEQNVKLKNRIA